MLSKTERLADLKKLLDHVRVNGWLLIADEKSNVSGFETVIVKHPVI